MLPSWRYIAGFIVISLLIGGTISIFAKHKPASESKAPASMQDTNTVSTKKESNTFRFVAYGDTRDGHDVHRKLVALIMAAKPDFIVHSGDLVHSGGNAEQWKTFDEITGEMRKQIPFYPARGNHDFGGTNYEDHVQQPFTSGNKLYYSIDHGNYHFVALAVDEETAFGSSSKQYKWLDKDLTQAKAAGKTIVVFFHVPPYSIGSHGSSTEVQEILVPVFIKYGVRLVINGHDHNYYRTRREGITYIVTGGGGAPLYPTDPKKGAIEGDKWEKANHFILFEVNGEDLKATVTRADGSTLEKFNVPKFGAAPEKAQP